MSKENGEYAFPRADQHFVSGSHGMTLRDYFAAKALQSLIDGQITVSGNGCMSGNGNGYTCRSRLCQEAYEFADSMLAERDK